MKTKTPTMRRPPLPPRMRCDDAPMTHYVDAKQKFATAYTEFSLYLAAQHGLSKSEADVYIARLMKNYVEFTDRALAIATRAEAVRYRLRPPKKLKRADSSLRNDWGGTVD
jgi:hypothetical protein